MTYSCIEWADIYFTYEQFKSYQLKRNHFRLYIYESKIFIIKKKSLSRKERIFRIILFRLYLKRIE